MVLVFIVVSAVVSAVLAQGAPFKPPRVKPGDTVGFISPGT